MTMNGKLYTADEIREAVKTADMMSKVALETFVGIVKENNGDEEYEDARVSSVMMANAVKDYKHYLLCELEIEEQSDGR